MNQQYVSPTNTLGKKKKKNNLVGGASAMQNISDLPEEDIGYTPGPSPVGGVLGQTHGGGPGAGGPGFVTTAPQPGPVTGKVQPYTNDPESEKAYRDMYSWIGKKMKSDQELKDVTNLTPPEPRVIPELEVGMFQQPPSTQPVGTDDAGVLGSLMPKKTQLPSETGPQLTPEQEEMRRRQTLAGTAYDPILDIDPEFLTSTPVTSVPSTPLPEAQPFSGAQPGVGMDLPDIDVGQTPVYAGGQQVLTPATGTPATGALSAITAGPQQPPAPIQVGGAGAPGLPGIDLTPDPTGLTGGIVTQPSGLQTMTQEDEMDILLPEQTQPSAPIVTTGAGAPTEPIDLTTDPEGLAGGIVPTDPTAGGVGVPERMTPEDELDILDSLSQQNIYGGTAAGVADTAQRRADVQTKIQAENEAKVAATVKAAQEKGVTPKTTQEQQALNTLGFIPTTTQNAETANFGNSSKFKNLMTWFATPKDQRVGNPLDQVETYSEGDMTALTPESKDLIKAYGDFLVNEQTRSDMARQFNITSLNQIGQTIDPDTGERVPTDVALSRQTSLANSLSSIAGQTFTPAEAAAYERGEISDALKTKLDESWAQVQAEQEEQINQMKSNIKLTDANAAVKLAEVTKMEGDLQLAKDELAWRKAHNADELTERQKARDAEMGRLQAELESVATREAQQRTHEQEMARAARTHEREMANLQQQTAFATQAMDMLSSNPSAIYALQTMPGLESLAGLMGISRRPAATTQPTQPQGLIPTVGSLQQGGQQAMQRAQTMAGIQQGLTPGEFAQQVRGVTPGGGFAPGVQQMTGITRTGRA